MSNAEEEVVRLAALIKQAEWKGNTGGYDGGEDCCPWCGQERYGYEGDEPTECPAFGMHAAEKIRQLPEPNTGALFGLEALIRDHNLPGAIARTLGPVETPMLSWRKHDRD